MAADRSLALAGVLWIAAVSTGTWQLYRYSAQAGDREQVSAVWPAGLTLHADRAHAAPTSRLVVLAHPRCSCTRASLRELARLLGRSGAEVESHVLFVRPVGCDAGWERSELWDLAESIPGVSVHTDAAGEFARSFGATTSGHVMLYDAHDRLLFDGGITASRAHEGESTGARAIYELLAGRAAVCSSTPVFGCALFDDATR